MNDADAAFDLRLGRVSPPTFAHRLEKNDCSLKLRLDMVHLAFPYSCHDVYQCPRQGSNLVLDLRRVACDPAHSKDILFRSTPPRNRTPSCRIEVCRAVHHTRRAKSGNRRCDDRRSPVIDSCHSQTVRLSYESACLASDLSRASPLRSKPRYNRALAFFAKSRSVSSSASRNNAGCCSNASADLTRSS